MWPLDFAWYSGTVTGFEGEAGINCKVTYEDGTEETLSLDQKAMMARNGGWAGEPEVLPRDVDGSVKASEREMEAA